MIPFPFNENRFSFFVADHLLVGQLCTNTQSDRSLLSCLKVTQCSTSEIGYAPLYNSCSLPIQVMTTGPLPAPSKWKSELPRITEKCPGWWKQSFRLRSWSLVWFQVRATSCNLTSQNVVAWLEFEPTYFEAAVQYINHCTTGTPLIINSFISFNWPWLLMFLHCWLQWVPMLARIDLKNVVFPLL